MEHSRIASCALLAALALGSGLSAQQPLEANKALVRRFAAAVTASDLAELDKLAAQNLRRHSQSSARKVTSLEQFKRGVKERKKTYPDFRLTFQNLVAEGDRVVGYGTFTGTQKGPLGDIPATGRSVAVKLFAMFRIRDHKIAEIWIDWDRLAVLTELGVYPPHEARRRPHANPAQPFRSQARGLGRVRLEARFALRQRGKSSPLHASSVMRPRILARVRSTQCSKSGAVPM